MWPTSSQLRSSSPSENEPAQILKGPTVAEEKLETET